MSPNLNPLKFYSLKSKTELFDWKDEIVPKCLREALMSADSQGNLQPQHDLSEAETATHIGLVDNDDIEKAQAFNFHDDDGEEVTELWETASMCPNSCNCGMCPMIDERKVEELVSNNSGSMSLMPSVSSISLREQSDYFKRNNSFLSITYVVPLRNYGAIIHWDVMHYHGIRGYKIYLDGNLVTSVHSPSRTSALIERVNMKYPHHFAVTIVPNVGEQIPNTFFHRSMQAIHIYRPNNFIH